jgi:hypothetical protein
MKVAKLAVRARATAASEEPRPIHNRTRQFLTLTIGAGVVSGLIALVGPVLVTAAGAALTTKIAASTAQPIKASAVFPPVGPQHKTVDVYDPAPPVRQGAPAPAPPAHETEPSPSPRPSHSPRPTPPPTPRPTPGPTPRATPPPDN